MEFKVGDRVQFKEWAELEKEFGVDSYGNINCHPCFNEEMRKYCGKQATITKINRGDIYLTINTDSWWISEDMLKRCNNKMTLTEFFDSNKKLAIHCKTEEQAETFCKEANKLGYKWYNQDTYNEDTNWNVYRQDTCYINDGTFCFLGYIRDKKEYILFEFNDIEWSTIREE